LAAKLTAPTKARNNRPAAPQFVVARDQGSVAHVQLVRDQPNRDL
jgi:hypothetical protein